MDDRYQAGSVEVLVGPALVPRDCDFDMRSEKHLVDLVSAHRGHQTPSDIYLADEIVNDRNEARGCVSGRENTFGAPRQVELLAVLVRPDVEPAGKPRNDHVAHVVARNVNRTLEALAEGTSDRGLSRPWQTTDD